MHSVESGIRQKSINKSIFESAIDTLPTDVTKQLDNSTHKIYCTYSIINTNMVK